MLFSTTFILFQLALTHTCSSPVTQFVDSILDSLKSVAKPTIFQNKVKIYLCCCCFVFLLFCFFVCFLVAVCFLLYNVSSLSLQNACALKIRTFNNSLTKRKHRQKSLKTVYTGNSHHRVLRELADIVTKTLLIIFEKSWQSDKALMTGKMAV